MTSRPAETPAFLFEGPAVIAIPGRGALLICTKRLGEPRFRSRTHGTSARKLVP
ncbi:hypothetical protein ACFOHY_22585 [Rhizobium rosettiformans]|uniref:hypothetical protein n=1 Tax=Rhizobium rosettiformans TaxID=1368430 RepID=UPI0036083FF0